MQWLIFIFIGLIGVALYVLVCPLTGAASRSCMPGRLFEKILDKQTFGDYSSVRR